MKTKTQWKTPLQYASVILGLIVVFATATMINQNIPKAYSSSTEEAIFELYNAIYIASQNGDYDCCIEPPCTMCYLGHWKFEKGTCKCDQAAAEGRTEDICPECKSGHDKEICTVLKAENGEFEL